MSDRLDRPDDPYEGIRIVGWGPFRMPGEKRRLRRAQEQAEEIMRARRELRERDERGL